MTVNPLEMPENSRPDDPSGREVPRARRFRFTMRSLMLFVLASAVASALFSAVRGVIPGTTNTFRVDVPAIVLSAIVLNAAALGFWLRLSLNRVLVQVTVCCLLVLGGVWLWEWKFARGLLYWLQASFAVGVVAPLAIRAYLVGDEATAERNRRVVLGVNDLLLAYANFVMILILAIFQGILTLFLIQSMP
jgi:hypothetical protein